MKNESSQRQYIPALRFDSLTRFYDPIVRWTVRESTFKQRLVEQARIQDGHKVLDLGCGTGTLSLLAKTSCAHAQVVGLDGDAAILEIARKKAAAASMEIAFDGGSAFDLPYEDNSFDRVISSLVFHHLTRQNKISAFRQVFRVLRPGGELHIADWGKPANILMRAAFVPVQLLDGFETTSDNVRGMLPEFSREVGFEGLNQATEFNTIFGTLQLYGFRKPA